MDPNLGAFRPHSETWLAQNELHSLQSIQAEHSDRLSRLERKIEDDARMKSVWGGASPFPRALSSTPQQSTSASNALTISLTSMVAPQPQPSAIFKSSDDDAMNLMSTLQLESEEEPRRLGPASRTNSVRFDESANQGHWAHPSRSSLDFAPRSGASSGWAMHERSSSHKSEGRASSVHSIRSAASGRASSITLDNGFGFGDSARSPIDTPILAPGLLVLGTVPAIIRCWMNADFKHDALLYAAICTGSHYSYIDMSLLQKLGLADSVRSNEDDDVPTVSLPVHLPEAIPHPASSSRCASPVPQLPTVTVKFHITEIPVDSATSKCIQIILGSDALRLHSADILFSTNSVSLFDDERNKMSIPLVRPEEERVFKSLQTVSRPGAKHVGGPANAVSQTLLNGLGQTDHKDPSERLSGSKSELALHERYRAPGYMTEEAESQHERQRDPEQPTSRTTSRPTSRPTTPYKSVMPSSRLRVDDLADTDDDSQTRSASRSASNIAAKTSWRQDSTGSNVQGDQSTATSLTAPTPQPDWTSKFKDLSSQTAKRDHGIKVLRPMRSGTSRIASTASTGPSAGPWATSGPTSPSAVSDSTRSRFFDDGKRRGMGSLDGQTQASVSEAGSDLSGSGPATALGASVGNNTAASGKRANPVGGGGSAFAWLNPGGAK